MQKVCRILLLFLLDLIPLRICLTCLTCVFDYNIILCFVDIETLYNPYYSLKLMKVWRNSEKHTTNKSVWYFRDTLQIIFYRHSLKEHAENNMQKLPFPLKL